jgi:hypothetical protein
MQLENQAYKQQVHLMANADDIVIMGRSLALIKEAFHLLFKRQVRKWD